MGFAVPPCRELAQGEVGWVSGRTHRYPSGQNNPKKPLRSCEQLLPSKAGICRWAGESSTFQESPWAHPMSRQVLSLGCPGAFSALGQLLWLRSQTNIWGFKGGRAGLMCPLARWCRGAGTGIIFYARRLCDPAEALGLRERLSSTTLTYFFNMQKREQFAAYLLHSTWFSGFPCSSQCLPLTWQMTQIRKRGTLVVMEMAVGRLKQPDQSQVMLWKQGLL